MVSITVPPGLRGRVPAALRPVTPAGRTVAVLAVAAWVVGWQTGWHELMVVAAACVLVLVVAVLFTLGRLDVTVTTDLEPPRVVAGEQALAEVRAGNDRSRTIWPLQVELPVGAARLMIDVPRLPPGGSHQHSFEIDTSRRGLIALGPASSLRSDPLGLLRRSVICAQELMLYVHPHTVPLPSFGRGVIRDLEGRQTEETANSGVEMHTLREYAPGDDRRSVHWPTTARTGTLMVRQYVDTRRSHLALQLSCHPEDYASDDEFEIAISVLASLVVPAFAERQAVTVNAGERRLATGSRLALLDATSTLELSPGPSLAAMTLAARRATTGVTVAVPICGSRLPVADLRAATTRWPREVRVLAVRVGAGERSAVRTIGEATLLDVAALADLPRLLLRVGRG